jgi:hypothetical protein
MGSDSAALAPLLLGLKLHGICCAPTLRSIISVGWFFLLNNPTLIMYQSCTNLSNTYYGLEKYELQGFSFALKIGKNGFRLSYSVSSFITSMSTLLRRRDLYFDPSISPAAHRCCDEVSATCGLLSTLVRQCESFGCDLGSVALRLCLGFS